MGMTTEILTRASATGEVGIVRAFSRLLAMKCPSTAGHAARCAQYARALANQLRLSSAEIEILGTAAILHDLGKIGIPDSILQKPGPLTKMEWHLMRQHPVLSHTALAETGGFGGVLSLVRHHHEHFDGSGYPDGLSGEDIPIGARILLVIDAFDAMTTDRPYRHKLPVAAAAKELVRCSSSQFDPRVVRAFLLLLCGLGHSRPLVWPRPAEHPEQFSADGDHNSPVDVCVPEPVQVA